MAKLTCMRGYSGSGKSTKARQIATDTGAVVVCRDDLRKMLLGAHWTGLRKDEDRVTVAEEAQVNALLRGGTSVVVDATHLHAPYLRRWARLATKLGVDFEVVDVYQPLDECKRNDHARMLAGGRYVGPDVIETQALKFPREKWPTVTAVPFHIDPYVPDRSLPQAILVDIDGTLAHVLERNPFDLSRVGEDAVDPVVRNIVREWRYGRFMMRRPVIILSGRQESCRQGTEEWLKSHSIPYDRLIMRATKDFRPDYQIKYELFNKHVRDSYNVKFVLDDRDQVVEMWRKLGLKCLQVQPGDF